MMEKLFERARAAFTRALAAALAAAFAFWIAHKFLGHPQPVFAAVSALICLAPGISDHLKQAMGLMIGVTLGILIGELTLLVPHDYGEVRMAVATFASMMLASLFGLSAVVPIQAGASAMLVLLLGPQSAGFVRFLDVSVGAFIGVAVTILFFRQKS
ncbi:MULTISPECIES: FUSC family protein [Rhizobium/Agrobacterium group]|uniref:FUSC family protein n=1 Tax=Rhizobium/Agrobacterium group TaxID=227290 RepID=UPI00110E0CDF|nr:MULTISPECIES: FUSC family protein [Rhizobium/Agrobacterium group]NWJ22802.1 FUSC family protein [Rhizobium sp. RM]TMV12296.1 aromatic acid exporter family protein [Rhizobium sp. Td3]UXS00744.1 aromatic acid exporter family protein [Agrobacterium tumefaciens]